MVLLAFRVKWKLDPEWMDKMSCGTAQVDYCYCSLPKPGLWHFVPEEILDLWWFNLVKLETSEISHSHFHSFCFYMEDCIDKSTKWMNLMFLVGWWWQFSQFVLVVVPRVIFYMLMLCRPGINSCLEGILCVNLNQQSLVLRDLLIAWI